MNQRPRIGGRTFSAQSPRLEGSATARTIFDRLFDDASQDESKILEFEFPCFRISSSTIGRTSLAQHGYFCESTYAAKVVDINAVTAAEIGG